MAALSQTFPDRLIEQTTPLSAISRWNGSLVHSADFKRSSQHLNEGSCDGHSKASITPL